MLTMSLRSNDTVSFWFCGYIGDIRTELQAPVVRSSSRETILKLVTSITTYIAILAGMGVRGLKFYIIIFQLYSQRHVSILAPTPFLIDKVEKLYSVYITFSCVYLIGLFKRTLVENRFA